MGEKRDLKDRIQELEAELAEVTEQRDDAVAKLEAVEDALDSD